MIEIIKKRTEVDTPLCRVKSGVDGLFVFPSVPSGEYTLVMKYCNYFTCICFKIAAFCTWTKLNNYMQNKITDMESICGYLLTNQLINIFFFS